VSWVLTILGICALVVLHELGHFTVAKAVGMRVERFSLFFPPTIFKVRRGETEYAIGAIPAGGYVKITGMNPEEIKDLHPDIARRAYYTQAPWKRIAVILAGPGVNIAIAFLLFWAILFSGSLSGTRTLENPTPRFPR
jgi:regulator of sigma E protease